VNSACKGNKDKGEAYGRDADGSHGCAGSDSVPAVSFTRNSEEHWHDLRILFYRLSNYGIIIKPTKCVFAKAEVDFLGIVPLPDKAQARFPAADNEEIVAKVRLSAWLISTDEGHHMQPVSNHVPFLSLNRTWKSLGFFSKNLQPTETRYSAYDKDLLAMSLLIKRFGRQLEGGEFTIPSHHHLLLTSSSRRLRELELIAQFTTDIRHITAIANSIADALSRIQETQYSNPFPLWALKCKTMNSR
ncbi:hypothetical protein M514_23944, partial [Trichuris suis]